MTPVLASSIISLSVAALLLLAVWRNRAGNSASGALLGRPERNLRQSPDDVAARKVPDWNFLVPRRRRHLDSARETVMDIFSGACKPPQPTRPALQARADRAYARTDAGDLSDPYQGRAEPTRPVVTHSGAARKLY